MPSDDCGAFLLISPVTRSGVPLGASGRFQSEAVTRERVPRPLRIFVCHPSHFLTDSEPHGDGLLAYEYITRLAKRGHQLHVAVAARHLEQPLPSNVYLYPLDGWIPSSGEHAAFAHRMEYALRVRKLYDRLSQTMTFDLIQQFNPVVRGISGVFSGKDVPVVLGPLPAPGTLPLKTDFASRMGRMILHGQIRRSSMVLVPNQASLPLIPAEDQRKARELHFGVDTKIFHPMETQGTEPPNILFLAGLKEQKGIYCLLEAFEILAKSHPDCILRFAGSGGEGAKLKERAERSPVADRIKFLGHIRREHVAEVMNSATVYCLPTLYEAFGMTALEAMACGRPVVGTNVGGLRLLLEGNSPAVPPNDAAALAQALSQVLSCPETQARMSLTNRRIAVEEYDWERVIDTLESLYRDLAPASLRPALQIAG